jgi:uncharacterized membrane protein HdeD (DUF308 family)
MLALEQGDAMLTLARNWWVLVVRGVLALLFGILAFVFPRDALLALVFLFGAYAAVDGIFALVAAFRAVERRMSWWPFVLEGIAGIALAVLTVVWPGITALALLYLIAAWAFATGIFEIAAAIRLRREIKGEFWLGLAGVLSIAFAVLAVLFPGRGALAVVWIIATYALIFGVVLVALGLRLRRLYGEERRLQDASAPA